MPSFPEAGIGRSIGVSSGRGSSAASTRSGTAIAKASTWSRQLHRSMPRAYPAPEIPVRRTHLKGRRSGDRRLDRHCLKEFVFTGREVGRPVPFNSLIGWSVAYSFSPVC